MLNYIWSFLLIVAVIAGALFGRFEPMINGMFAICKDVVMIIALPLAGMMMFWLGVMRLMEKSGLMRVVSRLLAPLMRWLFPDVPPNHPAMGAITMNMAANMLGLGNSATPLGLKAMQHLQELNPQKQSATNAMCMFLAINTAGVALMPLTAISFLASAGVPNPQVIIAPGLVVTFVSCLIGIFAAKWLQGRKAYEVQPDMPDEAPITDEEASSSSSASPSSASSLSLPRFVLTPFRKMVIVTAALGFLLGAALQFMPNVHAGLLEKTGLQTLLTEAEAKQKTAAERKAALASDPKVAEAQAQEKQAELQGWRQTLTLISALAIPAVLLITVLYALAKGVAVYDEMVEGAKEGFDVALRIMPYLVVMLTALTLFRESGALLLLQTALNPVLNFIGMPVELLPLSIMRPLSGSGASGLLNELILQPTLPDALKYISAVLYGSTETTFYVLAVYFGSVGIKRVRHALAAGLIADAAGLIGAVMIGRMVFGY